MTDRTEETLRRSRAVLGDTGMDALQHAHIAVFGLGGVGGYAAEALARCGVGALTLVDGDVFSPSNLNRQLFCTQETMGEKKAEVAAKRLAQVSAQIELHPISVFFSKETAETFDFSSFTYVIDAIDDVPAKVALAQICKQKRIPMIASMGAGNKKDPCGFRVMDLSKTHTDPLAKVMRKALAAEGITHLKTVCSLEVPCKVREAVDPGTQNKRTTVGSLPYTVGGAGLLIASAVVGDLCKDTLPYAPYGREAEA